MNNIKNYNEYIKEDLTILPGVVGVISGYGIYRFFNLIFTLLKIKKIKNSSKDALIDIIKNKRKLTLIKGPSTITIISDRKIPLWGGPVFSFQINTEKNKCEIIIKRKGIYNIDKNYNFDISEEEKKDLLEKIEKFIIGEEKYIGEGSDYRNVTGYGSMGSGDPQNAGPTYNRGMDAAMYHRPGIIGVTAEDISDKYFSGANERKRRKIKKDKKREKNRKEKTNYFNNLDKKINKKL